MVSVVENFSSFLWTDRYDSAGDFELYIPPTVLALSQYALDYYIVRPDTEHVMIIESALLESDENGYSYKISGESLESILKRRIAWSETTLSGNFQTAIKTLLNNTIISPSISERKIDNFVFLDSDDPAITELTIDATYSPEENVYDIIETNCKEFGIGFKVTLTSDNKFAFSLYKGTDRSFNQTQVPYVVFSPGFDNLSNSSFLVSYKDLKNVALVGGENTTQVVGEEAGLSRRETYVDASNIGDDATQLKKKGTEELTSLKKVEAFEGEANATNMFIYGKDFFVGDIVQLSDAFGNTGRSVISEIVFSIDEEGEKVYPTFVVPEEDGEEEQ